MRNQLLIFGTVITVSFLIMGSIAIFGKNSSQNQATPAAPILGLSNQSEQSLPSASDKTNSPAAIPEFTGAIEINASQSAATQSAQRVRVTLTNGKSFIIALYPDLAPKTVDNFLKKVRAKAYDGLLFFRVEKDPNTGNTLLAQTGDPANSGQGGAIMQAEYNKKPFLAGSVGVARGQNRDKNSDSQFFITAQPIASLNEEYTNFADVVQGLEVIQTIKQGQPILMIREVNE